MALRDKPYLPLYIQDFLTDEKLIECSAKATGVYIRLMCIMHKSKKYGTILLKQTDKQTDKQILNFAKKVAKQMPYPISEIEESINELLANEVLHIDGDFLIQKRMVSDDNLSETRALSGKKGGQSSQKNKNNYNNFALNFAKANSIAKSDIEYENKNINTIKGGEGGKVEIVNVATCYNIEEYMNQNQTTFEAVCMKAKKTRVVGMEELMKCHLHLEKNQKYPMAVKAAVAWFTSWLINSDDYNAKYGAPKSAKITPAEPPKKHIDEILKKYK